MKIHLAWIRMTAAAAIAAGVGLPPAAAQYAPYHPAPPQPAAPQAAATTPYVAYRPQPTYSAVPPARYQAPAMPAAPATAYRQPVTPYPQTAMAQYPAPYGGTPYVAQQQPVEAIPAPQQPTPAAAPTTEAMPGGTMSAGAMPMAEGAAPTAGGYPAAGCNCGANGGYAAGQYYGAGGCGNAGYPEASGYLDNGCNDNIWFGGVYFLYMTRTNPSSVDLTVEVPAGSTYPYYPPKTQTVLSTQNVDADFQPGMEVRLGCSFTIGDECSSGCGCGSGYGYTGCGCNTCAPSCSQTYAWEVAWWGLQDDSNEYARQDNINTRIYGMKNFGGLEYDRDGAGAGYAYMPVNSYYDYQMPVQAAGVNDTLVLAQRVRTNFNTQNLEVNVMRFPMIESCGGGCGCGGDTGGCGANYTGCGCQQTCCTSNFSSYGACGVRYFRVDDDFAYDTEFNEFHGGAYDHPTYDGFTYDNSSELFYDVSVDNNLLGPQVGWTSNYCCGCRWNFFWNSTFGIFDNHMTQYQRMFSGGGGNVRFVGSGDAFSVRSQKDAVAFLGELRAGASYDFTCHCRGVLAYRAVALSGVATSVGQIPSNFANIDDVREINSDNSLIVHGVQTGVEFRY